MTLTARELNESLQADADNAWLLEARLARAYQRAFRKLGRIAARRFARHSWATREGVVAAAGWVPPDPDEALPPGEARRIVDEETRTTRDLLAQTVVAGTLAKAGIAFDVSNPLLAGVLETMGRHITNVAETERAEIMRSVQQAYDEGLSIPKAARLIASRASTASVARGEMIARTELTAATSAGSVAAAQAATGGEGIRKQWLTAPGARYPRHELDADALESQIIPLTAAFDVNGYPAMHPADPSLPPEESVSCRCTLVYVQAGAMTASGSTITSTDEEATVASKAPSEKASPKLAAATPPTDEENQAITDAIGAVAKGVDTCGDYGDLYWDRGQRSVWWVACDGDDTTGVADSFLAVDGVEDAQVEAEAGPPDGSAYERVAYEDAQAAAAAEQMGEARHDYRGDGEECAICGKPPTDPLHYGQEEADAALSLPRFRVAGWRAVALQDAPPVAEAPVHVEGGVPFRALLCVEGVPTDDGRMIAEGATSWRELPLTLMAMIEEPDFPGHAGAVVAGRIDAIERNDQHEIIGTGVFDTGEYGAEIARLVDERTLRGVSVDLAVKAAEEVIGSDAEGGVEDPFFGEPILFVVTDGVIMGATVCPFPAFAEAQIETVQASARPLLAMHRSGDELGQVDRVLVLGAFQPQPQPDAPAQPGDAAAGAGMVALYPAADEAAAIADPDGNIPPEGLHVTLCYVPSGFDADVIGQAVDDFVAAQSEVSGAITGTVSGWGTFAAATDEEAGGAPIVLLVDAPGLCDFRCDLADALEAAGVAYSTDHDFVPHITVDYDDPNDLSLDAALAGKPLTFSGVSIVASDGTRADVPIGMGMTASAAGAAPELPPREWFTPPAMEGPTPLTVTREGRVYGHLAPFGVCHTGKGAGVARGGECLTAPHHHRGPEDRCDVCGERRAHERHSAAGYELFHHGEVETAEGDLVSVGQITLDTGHPAARGVSAAAAMRHYDHTGLVAADVRVSEDEHGVTVAGALRPDLPASKARALRAAAVSGDWRYNDDRLELIGALAVNVPGFPIPRPRRAVEERAGRAVQTALVAAGVLEREEHRYQLREGREYLQERYAVTAEPFDYAAGGDAGRRIRSLVAAGRRGRRALVAAGRGER